MNDSQKLTLALAALQVIALDAKIQHWLAVNDPQALKQVRHAVSVLGDSSL